MSDTINIVLCGVGGQGTVLASKLIAAAAMAKGMEVMSAETIGMAQRGGSVFSHVRIGGEIHTPMIAAGKADLIIGFEPGEAARMLPFLKPHGQMIVSSRGVMPVTASLSQSGYDPDKTLEWLSRKVSRLTVVDTDKACSELGSAKVMNVLLLGAAVHSGALGLTEEEIAEALKKRLPEKLHELNLKALRKH
ncbi:MAG: indolepyruvate oxidoreductase subunit beta [Huintestinicola sp.]